MECELKAVMKIKMQFFKWFEKFFKQTKDFLLHGMNEAAQDQSQPVEEEHPAIQLQRQQV